MDELRRRQEELVRALTAGGPVPAGFDARRLRVAADALLTKRCNAVAARLPLAQAELGCGKFAELFVDWARDTPHRPSQVDAAEFVAYLERAGQLSPRRRSRWWRRDNW